MIDVKILTIRDLLPLAKVDYATGISPLSLVITGTDLNETTEIRINDIRVSEFIILSPSRIVAQVPISERGSIIRSVVVLANKPSANRRSLLHFEAKSITGIRGLERLIQIFCKQLLQTPGSNKFRRNDGGGLQRIIGRSTSRNDSKTLQASVVAAVSRTRDQVLARQASKSRIPTDERLLSAIVEAVSFDAATTTLTCRVAISAVSGRQAVANISL